MPVLLNAYCTHKNLPTLMFPHRLLSQRDRRDPELARHLHGFMGFVMQGGQRPMNATRFHVLGHIERVRHQVALEIEAEDMPAFAAWAASANAIVFSPDGAVRAPSGAVLVDPASGDAQPGAHVPHLRDAADRKARTEEHLQSCGVPFARSLPPVASEAEVELRSTREIAMRSMALLLFAQRGDSLAAKAAISTQQLKERIPLGFDALSPNERAFVESDSPSEQAVVASVWRYEALEVLAWSVGALPELPFPAAMCDVDRLTKTMFAVMKSFTPASRITSEILDALDLHLRLNWAVRDAEINGRPTPAGIEPGVVAERHHALNWLTRFQDADWDDVDTPT